MTASMRAYVEEKCKLRKYCGEGGWRGEGGMWKRSANHKGKPILRSLSDVIPGRNNAGINLFCDNCVQLIALITVRTEPEASGNAFTFHQSVFPCERSIKK